MKNPFKKERPASVEQRIVESAGMQGPTPPPNVQPEINAKVRPDIIEPVKTSPAVVPNKPPSEVQELLSQKNQFRWGELEERLAGLGPAAVPDLVNVV